MAPAPTRSPARAAPAPLLALAGLLALAALVPLRAQEGPDDLATEALDALDAAIDDYDLAALQEALVDLDLVYDTISERTRTKVLRALDGVLQLEERKETRTDGSDPLEELHACYELTVGLLYDKAEGAELLVKALKRPHVRAWPKVAAHIVEGLGYRVDPALVEVLAGQLLADPAVAVAAAEGLARFSEAEFALRRQIAVELAAAYVERHRAAEKEARKGKEETAREQLLLVQGAMDRALEKLTRQQLGDAESWQAWISANPDEAAW